MIYFRSRYKDDVESFIHEKMHERPQRELIETQVEMNAQLKSFLPKEIYLRMEELLSRKKISPMLALNKILTPRKIYGAVVYSDIRGYTGLSKDHGDLAKLRAIFPAQSQCTDAVEDNHGVPRIVGDLLFSYFDSDDKKLNLIRAMNAAFKIADITRKINEQNKSESFTLNRYSIVTCGDLIAGNLGGTSGSREIAVIGNAANMTQRIDTVSKDLRILKKLSNGDTVILSREARNLLILIRPEIYLDEISLRELGLSMKDFSEETILYSCSKKDWKNES